MLQRMVARLKGAGKVGPVSGSIADALLQRDLLAAIGQKLRAEDDREWQLRVEILERPPMSADGAMVVGPWLERWAFTSGDLSADFTITFTPSSQGGTDYHVEGTIGSPAPEG